MTSENSMDQAGDYGQYEHSARQLVERNPGVADALGKALFETRNAVWAGHLLNDVRAADDRVASLFDEFSSLPNDSDHHGWVRKIEIPSEPMARERFIREWVARNQKQVAQGAMASLLVLPFLAHAQSEIPAGFVRVDQMHSLVERVLLEDGSLRLKLADGSVVNIDAASVVVDGGQIYVNNAALIEAGIPASVVEAAAAESVVAAEQLDGVVEILSQPDGSARVIMQDGAVVELPAGTVRVVEGVSYVNAGAAAEAGLAVSTLPSVGLGAVAQVSPLVVGAGGAAVAGIAAAGTGRDRKSVV